MPSNVIRSVVTPEGIIAAHASGLVVFTPNRGTSRQIVLPAAATSMLALVGPQQRANRLLVGDRGGALHVLMLPQMELLSTHQLGDVPVSALESQSKDDSLRLVAGLQDGRVLVVGDDIPGGIMPLFRVDGPVSLIRCVDDQLHVNCGWERHIRHWNGDHVSSSRPHRQLSLTEATPAPG
jgi:hypothetical protein